MGVTSGGTTTPPQLGTARSKCRRAWERVKRSQGGGPVASRTQIVCLCEGTKGESIDEVFIYALLNALKPGWVRPQGSNIVRLVPCGGRKAVVEKMPVELQNCMDAGSDTTL